MEKTANEIQEESSQEEDEINMKEMQRIADTIIKHVETEYDCPSRHPELDFKVPVLDLGVWVEEIEVASPGLEVQELHVAATMTSACPLESLELLSSLRILSLTQPQYTGGVCQVVPFTIVNQMLN